MPIYLIADYDHIKNITCEYVQDALEGPFNADMDMLRNQWLETAFPLNLHNPKPDAFVTWLLQQPGWGTVFYEQYNIGDGTNESIEHAQKRIEKAWGKVPYIERCAHAVRNGYRGPDHEWQVMRDHEGSRFWICLHCDKAVPVEEVPQ